MGGLDELATDCRGQAVRQFRTGAAVALSVGDVVCLPHGCGHALADSPATSLTGAPSASLREIAPSADEGEGATTVLLCGAYTIDRTRPHPLF
ncbi:hypothetical protein SCOCK_140195 [Actinacidiphila cocklensis]|uniref:AraC-type transcription regulator ligand-binding domain-containing protein n=1 Tax=Actinacidiphila cocklensis TaxID=887465 RepID=A0A9W4DII4_9ACTN|nr:hypothetical protein SCOCK_140195 [Actinacidiphila cocklensis]